MASARSRKSLSVEEILAETCTDTLSGGPRDVLSESDDDNMMMMTMKVIVILSLKLQGK
jgi:hypothetical protein